MARALHKTRLQFTGIGGFVKQLIWGATVVFVGCGLGSGGGSSVGSNRAPLCPATPGPALMTNAVCACEGLQGVGNGMTTKSRNPNVPANVGLNRAADVTGHWEIAGSLRAYEGISGVGNISTRDDLVSFADLSTVGRVKVGRDLAVKNDVQQVGRVDVAGLVKVGGQRSLLGSMPSARVGAFDLVDALPCNCNGLDVKTEVANAKANSAVQRLAEVRSVGTQKVVLTMGSYFVPSIDQVGFSEIVIDGAVSLYVDGDIRTVGNLRFNVPPGSTLDLYVAGNLDGVGATMFKQAPAPGAVRFYIGSGFQHVGWQDLPVSIYAPQADIDLVGGTIVRGSILARNIGTVGNFTVEFSQATYPSADVCTPPPGGVSQPNPNGPADPQQPAPQPPTEGPK